MTPLTARRPPGRTWPPRPRSALILWRGAPPDKESPCHLADGALPLLLHGAPAPGLGEAAPARGCLLFLRTARRRDPAAQNDRTSRSAPKRPPPHLSAPPPPPPP